MNHRRWIHAAALAACLALAAQAGARQERLALSGHVVMDTPAPAKKRAAPLPRFTVRLYFPREMNRPTIVTYTDAGGNFKFDDLQAGRYLLELYQSNEMVYQKALALDGNLPQPLVITLKPR